MRLSILLLTALLLWQIGAGCGTDSQNTSSPGTSAGASTQAVQTPTAPKASTPSSSTSLLQPPALQGPTNFLLTIPLNFSSVDGATRDDTGAITQLDTSTIKTQVTAELKRLLFVVDSNDNVKVYSPGISPVAAHITPNTDGSAAISYTQTVDSEAGTITIKFDGVLLKGQITATYQQQYTPSLMINANTSAVAVTFTTGVRWVSANQIPAAPTNGAYQLTSKGGVAIAWSAAQNAVAYNVYRLISDQSQQFQLLATVKGLSYADDSPDAIQNMHSTKGITYTVFSVGPTGVENPGGIVIPISG